MANTISNTRYASAQTNKLVSENEVQTYGDTGNLTSDSSVTSTVYAIIEEEFIREILNEGFLLVAKEKFEERLVEYAISVLTDPTNDFQCSEEAVLKFLTDDVKNSTYKKYYDRHLEKYYSDLKTLFCELEEKFRTEKVNNDTALETEKAYCTALEEYWIKNIAGPQNNCGEETIRIYIENDSDKELEHESYQKYKEAFENKALAITPQTVYDKYWPEYQTAFSSVTVYDKYWPIYQSALNSITVYDKYWTIYKKDREGLNVYEIFWEKYQSSKKEASAASNTGSSKWNYIEAKGTANNNFTAGETKQAVRELRPTPGYTNYVVDTRKNLSGIVSSAMLKRYYSNIDAEIYVNGEWVEDIGTIQWSIDQQTMPLYGYNSYIFDDMAQGSRIISGSFTLAFTAPRRLEEVIRNYLDTNQNAKTISYEEMISQLSTKKVQLNRNGKNLVSNRPHMPIWAGEKFDIDIVCGEYETVGGEAVHIILKDCWLTGTKSARSKDGGVAEELYTFIGRDFKTIS